MTPCDNPSRPTRVAWRRCTADAHSHAMNARLIPAALTLLGLAVAGCDDHTHDADAAALACTDPAQVSLPNCSSGSDLFSDESCTALDDGLARAQRDDARAPTVTAPTEAQAISATMPFTFRWEAPVAAYTPPGAGPQRLARAFTWRDDLVRWTTLVPEAQAHCAPFSGRGYELQFRVGGRVVLRRQQSATSYTPGPDAWDRLRAAAGTSPVELTVYTAVFNQNTITPGNGPFAATAPRRFTFAP